MAEQLNPKRWIISAAEAHYVLEHGRKKRVRKLREAILAQEVILVIRGRALHTVDDVIGPESDGALKLVETDNEEVA